MQTARTHLPVIGLAPATLYAPGPGALKAAIEVIAIGAVAMVGVAAAIALVELSVRVARERRRRDVPVAPVLTALHAQRLYTRVLYGLAPATVAAVIAFLRTDQISDAGILFGAMVLTAAVLRSHTLPLQLMPIARYAFNAFVPLAGVLLALLPGLFASDAPVDQGTAIAVLLAASLTGLMAGFLESRFEADAPIRLAVIGPGSFTEKLASELRDSAVKGYTVVGYLSDEQTEESAIEARRLGTLEDVREAIGRDGIDLLVVAPQNPRLAVFEQIARATLDLPVRMIEATALYEDVLGHVPIGTINSAWFQFIMHPRYTPSSPLSKRILDLIVSAVMLVSALPVLLFAALAVKLEDRGPVFYRQRRVGEEGREFQMLKFRTMAADADERRDAESEEELVTRVGRILRALHLNELPQLAQVLKGDMSLVGPRPEPPELVEELMDLVPYYERRALVKPGLTGWAQVRCGYAGSRVGTAWKMCHDLYYVKHRSARLDLLIMVQTLHALVERDRMEQLPAEDFILGEAAELVGR